MLWLRITARPSGVLLACAFAAPALRALIPSAITVWIAARRHRFILAFALSHTFHLAGVVALFMLDHDRFSGPALPGVIGGGLAYGLIYYLAGMAWLRRSRPELLDSKMQTFSLYILWSTFTLAFIVGLSRSLWIYAPLVTIMLTAFVVRMCARFSAAGHRIPEGAGKLTNAEGD